MMDVNWVAVIIAAVVSNAIGFGWYSDALFGKQWRALSDIPKEKMQASKGMGRMLFLMAVSSLVMAYVLAVIIGEFGAITLSEGLTVGFWVWLGFAATIMLSSVTYEGKSWGYYGINIGYQLVSLLVMGALLAVL